MLTSVDIHYLVGILCYVSNPDDVEIILGDMVYNEASETERDVDITITYKDKEGSINAFLGYEVKDHARPLDSSHVEQLCAKLKTHNKITKGYIVSSSGYTEPAKRIAKSNNIELYHLKKWENRWNEFAHIKLVDDLLCTELIYEWVHPPYVAVYTSADVKEEDIKHVSDDCFIYNSKNLVMPGLETIAKLKEFSAKNSLLSANSSPQFEKIQVNEETITSLKYVMSDDIKVLVNGNYYQITSTETTGLFVKKEVQYIPDFKILADINDDKQRVGCIITETSMGHLAGLAITEQNRGIQMILIPISDRLKKKIFRQKIT